MALTSYPFENANTTEDQYTLLFRNFAETGIVGTYGDGQFSVSTDGSGLDVQVAAGYAILRGHAVQNDGPVTVNIDTADSQFPRIDRLVLRLDPVADGIRLHVIKGTANANPTVPPLVQTDTGIFDLPVAQVTVPALALNITTANIVGERQWAGGDVGVWRTETRPVEPRQGKVGWNVSIAGLEAWNGSAWERVGITKKTVRFPHTFTLAGPVVLASGDDYYIPPFVMPVPAGQKVTLRGMRHFLRTGGTANFDIRVNGAVVYSGTASTTATSSSPLAVNVTDNAPVSIVITGVSSLPKNLTCSLFFDYEV